MAKVTGPNYHPMPDPGNRGLLRFDKNLKNDPTLQVPNSNTARVMLRSRGPRSVPGELAARAAAMASWAVKWRELAPWKKRRFTVSGATRGMSGFAYSLQCAIMQGRTLNQQPITEDAPYYTDPNASPWDSTP